MIYILGGVQEKGYIHVIFPTTSISVICSNGTKTLKVPEDRLTGGGYLFKIPSFGTWTVESTNGVQTESDAVSITAEGQFETVKLVYEPRAYGATWDGSSTTQFSRLDDAAGFADPTPAVGTGSGSSPFDDIMPWAGMKEFNVINNAIAYEKGVDSEFSRSKYDTVVKIPKFWYKISATGSEWQVHIANGAMDGYTLHPAFEGKDAIYIGKYLAGEGYVSKSAVSPIVDITRPTFRENARGKGANWDMLNIAAWSAVTMLYLVEYADWDSQSVIGKGYTSGSARINTGGTDSMTYHTGRPAGTDGLTSIQYRGIEDLWGNVEQWVDGINFKSAQAYYCTTRTDFEDDVSDGYTKLSYACAADTYGGYPKAHGLDANAPWIFLPTTVGGSNTTYIPDAFWTSRGWAVFSVGGGYVKETDAGLLARNAFDSSWYTCEFYGGRLLFIPD